jgi:hypothetical protein
VREIHLAHPHHKVILAAQVVELETLQVVVVVVVQALWEVMV